MYLLLSCRLYHVQASSRCARPKYALHAPSYILLLMLTQESNSSLLALLYLEKRYYQNEAADALVHRSASQIDAAESNRYTHKHTT